MGFNVSHYRFLEARYLQTCFRLYLEGTKCLFYATIQWFKESLLNIEYANITQIKLIVIKIIYKANGIDESPLLFT